MDKLWTEAELATYCQVSQATIKRERQRGRLKYTRIGTKIRYTDAQIADYLKDQEGKADPRQKPKLAIVGKR